MTDPLLAQLATVFADVTGSNPPDPDADLLEGEVLDSLALVELLFVIEQELGIMVPAENSRSSGFAHLRASPSSSASVAGSAHATRRESAPRVRRSQLPVPTS